MKTFIKTLFVAGVAALTLGCSGNSNNQESTETVEVEAIKVNTYVTVAQDVTHSDVYSSSVEANIVNKIAPQSASRIQKINVEVGDFVTAGQVLAKMDNVSLLQAKLKLVNDSTELSRVRNLYEEGGVTKSDYEAMELGYNVSKTQFKNLKENTILRAPVSGVITERNYDQGDMYSMGSPIYVLQQISPVKLHVGITESEYSQVQKGDAVEISTEALPGRTFNGRVSRVFPTIDPATHTFTAEILVPNNDRALRPGMYAKVNVVFGVEHNVVVPDVAVVKQQGSNVRIVYVLNEADNTVKATIVKLGRHIDNNYEILEGLSEGVTITTKGSASLKDGSKVEVVE